MNATWILLLALMSSQSLPALAQQTAGKPVLTATPPPPDTTPAPSLTSSRLAPPGSTPVAVDPNYVIGPDDSLLINVHKEPTYSENVLVRPDGMISIPDIGDVPAAGRTPMQLAGDITTVLQKLIRDPTVTVSVLSVNSKRIYLVGEIGHVGPLAMTPNMTVFQAIATAGGLSAFANKKHIYILRGQPGQQKKIPFDYNKALKTGDSMLLVPGDTIVVP
ncbi:MAG: polysaccharide biosynthesis/export family protein [Acidobacteriota bacterium]|nr:polysaccharide biosynthesis/export family protein [Acidobacteriota bacterium]